MATGPARARVSYTAVWTGTEMIVWGGFGIPAAPLQGLARYRPVENTWNIGAALFADRAGGRFLLRCRDQCQSHRLGHRHGWHHLAGSVLRWRLAHRNRHHWRLTRKRGVADPPASIPLTVVATDNNNLKTTSAPVSVTIIGPPTVSLTSPADGATIPGSNPIALTANGERRQRARRSRKCGSTTARCC